MIGDRVGGHASCRWSLRQRRRPPLTFDYSFGFVWFTVVGWLIFQCLMMKNKYNSVSSIDIRK